MEFSRGRYSWLLRPLLIIIDISIINLLAYFFLSFNDKELYFFSLHFLNNKYLLYFLYSLVLWLISTRFFKFYRVFRYTSALNILSLLVKQFLFFAIIVYAFVGFFRSINISAFLTLKYLVFSFLAISFFKLSSFYILRFYRLHIRGNFRNIIVIGSSANIKDLLIFFNNAKDLGYILKRVFRLNDSSISSVIDESFDYLEQNKNIDEIYCSIDELSENQINAYVKYANINRCNIKFIPSNFKYFEKRLKTDYYNYLPILSIQEAAFNEDFNKYIKRIFDILLSIFVIVCILPWLSIILVLIIKLESKGPLFYRHIRNGINYKEFVCFKYRTLKITKEIKGNYIKQEDSRVTKIGKFLRKTSIDELPQFWNVLKGDMSVVGPRPHMLTYTEEYAKKIDKYNYIFRHHVKPGITGLAQIKGYRGEIVRDTDIINRIKYDIFYIENWSVLLDLKIIFQTIVNILKGDEKAY